MHDANIKILLVEDNPADACILTDQLSEASVQVDHASSMHHALRRLAVSVPQAILLDLGLPDVNGLEAVRRAHSAAPDVPLIVLTGLQDRQIAIQALHEGAQDFLTKGAMDADSLLRALLFAIERHKAQAAYRQLALVDELTGLHNRRAFLALAEQNLRLARRNRHSYVMVFVDLDGLKYINDNLGHELGDEAIKEAADVLRDCFRQSDILARLGGDEFVGLMVDAHYESTSIVRHRLEARIRKANLRVGRKYALSLSLGVVFCPPDESRTLEQILSAADSMMYAEKKSKRMSRANLVSEASVTVEEKSRLS